MAVFALYLNNSRNEFWR